MLTTPLFNGARIRLAAVNPDRDATLFSTWTHDPDLQRRISDVMPVPKSETRIKRQITDWQQENDKLSAANFALRIAADDGERLIGYGGLRSIVWPHGTASVKLYIGAAADRNLGYGAEALALLLRYAFDELSLHRIGALMPAHNAEAMRFFVHHGFCEEVRTRQAFQWRGQRWDDVWLGMLQSEWRQRVAEQHV